MQADPWDVVVYGTAVHRASGETRPVRMGWVAAERGAWFLESGGRVLKDEGVPPESMDRYTRLIFGDPGGGGESVRVADPVNLDGSPRTKLLDRLARRGLESRSLAAMVVATGGALLRLGMGSGMWCNLAGGIWHTMG